MHKAFAYIIRVCLERSDLCTLFHRSHESKMPSIFDGRKGFLKRNVPLTGFFQMFGLGLALIGLGGMLGLGGVLGLGEILGLRDTIAPREEVRFANNVLYLLTGLLLSFVGLGRLEQEQNQQVIGGVGVLYLLSAFLSVGGKLLFEVPLDLYSFGYDLERAMLGVLFVLVVKVWSPSDKHVGEVAHSVTPGWLEHHRRRKTIQATQSKAASSSKLATIKTATSTESTSSPPRITQPTAEHRFSSQDITAL